MTFDELNLNPQILKALKAEGYNKPTPIQEKAIGPVLEGKDILGTAQTGTGKTAAFALPILQMLQDGNPVPKAHRLRALVLSPTRELAIQIKDNFVAYGKFLHMKSTVIYGGVSQIPQVSILRSGVDILIATPGRLLDLMNQKLVNLQDVKHFVLDEADHMLDMGFITDVNKIISKLPEKRQTLMFSATMPKEIVGLADSILNDPVRIAINPTVKTVDLTNQYVYFVEKHDKRNLLIDLLKKEDIESALVFSRTKHGADKIVTDLFKAGIKAEAIHGNKSQSARQLALRKFKNRSVNVLVATDIAARGIDVSGLSHVINYDLPEEPETYVHRIGRTGRAGQKGTAISFCDKEDLYWLSKVQKLIGQKIPVVTDHEYAADFSDLTKPKKPDLNRFRSASSKSVDKRYRSKSGGASHGYRPKSSPSFGKGGRFRDKKPQAHKSSPV